MENKKIPFLCRIGFHSWDKWINVISERSGWSFYKVVQKKYCSKCNIEKVRLLFKDFY